MSGDTRGTTMIASDEGGYSLVELLVIVIIIGILAAIAIPIFLNQQKRAHDAAAKSDLRNAAMAEESYFADHGKYAGIDTVAGSEGVKLSRGTTIVSVFVKSTSSFCLGAVQNSGSPVPASQAAFSQWAPSVIWWWDSAAGGLQPRNAPLSPSSLGCPATNTASGAALDGHYVLG